MVATQEQRRGQGLSWRNLSREYVLLDQFIPNSDPSNVHPTVVRLPPEYVPSAAPVNSVEFTIP